MASNMENGTTDQELEYADKPEGPVAAAILAGGVGTLALGILTTLAEASTGFKDFLNLYDPVGPLSGKTSGAVLVWLVAWGVLHMMYKDKEIESRKALTAALFMIGLGVIGTFPIFFQLFTPPE